MKKFELTANQNEKLATFLIKNVSGLSFNTFNKLLRKKDIKVNGKPVNDNISLTGGESIVVFIAENQLITPKFYEVVHSDKNVLIVNKSAGIIVASKDKPSANVVALQDVLEADFGCKLFVLHRLDRNTSGLVIFAKTYEMLTLLKDAMEKGEIEKYYRATVYGDCTLLPGVYKGFLETDSKISKSYITRRPTLKGEEIKTEIISVDAQGYQSELLLKIKNGKTHQIRAHLAFLGFPIMNDSKYASHEQIKAYAAQNQKSLKDSQSLSAVELIFHFTNEKLKYLNSKTIRAI